MPVAIHAIEVQPVLGLRRVAVVVNGKYRTNPELAGGASRILDIVNELITIEQKDDATPGVYRTIRFDTRH